jgi:hypothetical protein
MQGNPAHFASTAAWRHIPAGHEAGCPACAPPLRGRSLSSPHVVESLDQRIGIDDNRTQTWTVYYGSSPDALPYADFNGSGGLSERYLSGPAMVNGAVVDVLLSRTDSSGTTAWYLTDKLDSVRDIVSASGTELDHIVYDAFGNIVSESDPSNGDRFKYADMEYDYAISYCSPCTSCHCSPGAVALLGWRSESELVTAFDYRLLTAFSPSVPRRLAA